MRCCVYLIAFPARVCASRIAISIAVYLNAQAIAARRHIPFNVMARASATNDAPHRASVSFDATYIRCAVDAQTRARLGLLRGHSLAAATSRRLAFVVARGVAATTSVAIPRSRAVSQRATPLLSLFVSPRARAPVCVVWVLRT